MNNDEARKQKNEYMKAWRAKNKEKVKAAQKKYWEKKANQTQEGREALNEYMREWRKEHPESVKKSQENYWVKRAQQSKDATDQDKQA